MKVCLEGILDRDLIVLVGSCAVDEFLTGDDWVSCESGATIEPLDSGPKPKDAEPPEAVLQAE